MKVVGKLAMYGIDENQKLGFEERITRINHGKAFVADQIHATSASRKLRRVESKKAKRTDGLQKDAPIVVSMVSLPFAMIIGLISMLIGRMLVFHYAGTDIEIADPIGVLVLLLGDVGVGIALSVLLMLVFGLNTVALYVAAALGFAAMMFGEPVLAGTFPEIWIFLFSPEYVNTLQ